MLDTRFSLFPLTSDEQVTCQSMLSADSSRLLVMPTHHIDEMGNFMGFRYTCDPYIVANTLPIVRNMFHGTTMVQCDVSEDQLLNLMLSSKQNKETMLEFLKETEENCVPARLDCIPENLETMTKTGSMQATGLRTVDSKNWTPEVPDRIGLYHAYIKGYNRDVRTHRLFIIVSGGLYKACDEFCNLMIDVGKHWTVNDVLISEEVWWLKKACQRARCRLIKQVADKFNIKVTHIEDIQSYKLNQMVIPTTDTLEHDLCPFSNNRIAVYNSCMDTTRNMNGMLCNMHPSEGVWLFKGAHKASCFGSMYGSHDVCGVFPINAPKVKRPESLCVSDSSCIVRLHSASVKEDYMCFDESYFKGLEGMQWNRDNGYEALIPIIVGLK